jgi:adenylate cyclase
LTEEQRKLAAIVFTDIVGYTTLSQRNEMNALHLLWKHNEMLRSSLGKYHGKEVKTMGDAFLLEFESALDAARWAIEIQKQLHERNLAASDSDRFNIRIGIHEGDVIHTGTDALGDAVNIASRIEPLADPGGICISESVYLQVRNRVPHQLAKLGEQKLKNVEVPITLYRIVLPWQESLTVRVDGDSDQDRQRVAVLPFANISADAADEYFADGMTEELISTLSRVNELSVISRTSAMQYKAKSKPIVEIGRELKAGTIVEGSVRKAVNRVRITVRMVDAKQDRQLWAESYDREIQDIFAVHSDIAQRIAEALRVRLLPSEKEDIERIATENTQAYTLYLKGRYYWNERSKEGNDKAAKFFEEAVKLDPKFALAYAGLADCYTLYGDYGWASPEENYPKAREYSMKAIEIDPDIAEAHTSLAWVCTAHDWKWEEAEKEFSKAMQLKPSYATAHQWYALFLSFLDRYGEAYEQVRRASELDPLSRVIGFYLAYVLLMMGRKEEATEQCKRVIEANPDYADAHRLLGFMYYMDSRNDEAIEEARRAVAISGGDALMKGELASVLGFIGQRAEADRILGELKDLSETTYVPSVEIAQVLLSLGRRDEAFEYLGKVDSDRSSRALFFRTWPWYSEFRKDTRWLSVENRMGLSRSAKPSAPITARREQPAALVFRGANAQTKVLFDFLVDAFIEDYMTKRLYIDQSGWRSLIQIADACKMPQRELYGRSGRYGPTIEELITRGLVELRTFTGHRGRGGSAIKVRIAYDREPTKRYVDRVALES